MDMGAEGICSTHVQPLPLTAWGTRLGARDELGFKYITHKLGVQGSYNP